MGLPMFALSACVTITPSDNSSNQRSTMHGTSGRAGGRAGGRASSIFFCFVFFITAYLKLRFPERELEGDVGAGLGVVS